MGNFFNMENGFFRGLAKLTDCVILSIYFLISCLPIFTIGAAFSALYYSVRKVIQQDRGYVTGTYWRSFRDNFKTVTPVWLLMLLLGGLLLLNINISSVMIEEGNPLGFILYIFIFILILEFAWGLYLFPYMARFENTRKNSMKNTVLLTIAYLPRTLLLILNAAVCIALVIFLFPTLIVVPALHAWIQSLILEKIFRRHMTDEDREYEEELTKEMIE